jgi:hypothetical protein
MIRIRGIGYFILLSSTACVLPHMVWAQLARVGGEFQINTYSPGLQRSPRVAGLPDSGFVVVWESEGQDGDGTGLFGRRFGADGQPSSPEFQVNTTTFGSQRDAHVAVAGDGTFVVVWTTYPPAPAKIMGQRFDAAGNRLGSEFEVLDDDFRDIYTPDVAAAPGGTFVVAWGAGTGLNPPDEYLIRGRMLDSSAQPAGPSFSISSSIPLFEQSEPALANGRDNSLIVVWYVDDGAVITGRMLDAQSQPTGPEFTIAAGGGYAFPQICSHQDGAFVVTWSSYGGSERLDQFVLYRRYDDAGNALTPPLRITDDASSPYANFFEVSPRIACGRQRQTVLVWDDGLGIRARAFPDDSLPASSEFRIRSGFPRTAVGGQSVAMLDDQDFVLAWTLCDTDSNCDALGQRFTLRGPTDCPGDCNRDGSVTVDELMTAINIAVDGQVPMKECLPADTNLDYSVSVDELVTAVNRALRGCS